jgi:hypothetical protein
MLWYLKSATITDEERSPRKGPLPLQHVMLIVSNKPPSRNILTTVSFCRKLGDKARTITVTSSGPTSITDGLISIPAPPGETAKVAVNLLPLSVLSPSGTGKLVPPEGAIRNPLPRADPLSVATRFMFRLPKLILFMKMAGCLELWAGTSLQLWTAKLIASPLLTISLQSRTRVCVTLCLLDDLDKLHHALVFVNQDVAMNYKLSREPGVSHPHFIWVSS